MTTAVGSAHSVDEAAAFALEGTGSQQRRARGGRIERSGKRAPRSTTAPSLDGGHWPRARGPVAPIQAPCSWAACGASPPHPEEPGFTRQRCRAVVRMAPCD
ncbi:unnamed protein product [Lampetra planeri]